MGVVDVDRAEAERLGLLAPDEPVTPEPVPFPAMPQLSMPSLDGQDALRRAILGMVPGARFEDGVLILPEQEADDA